MSSNCCRTFPDAFYYSKNNMKRSHCSKRILKTKKKTIHKCLNRGCSNQKINIRDKNLKFAISLAIAIALLATVCYFAIHKLIYFVHMRRREKTFSLNTVLSITLCVNTHITCYYYYYYQSQLNAKRLQYCHHFFSFNS